MHIAQIYSGYRDGLTFSSLADHHAASLAAILLIPQADSGPIKEGPTFFEMHVFERTPIDSNPQYLMDGFSTLEVPNNRLVDIMDHCPP